MVRRSARGLSGERMSGFAAAQLCSGLAGAASLCAALSWVTGASAEQLQLSAGGQASSRGETASDATDRGDASPSVAPGSDAGALLAAVKAGAALPLGGLSPFVAGGVQLGWVFGGTQGTLAAYLDVTLTSPAANGKEPDDRLAGGEYSWEITQKELILQPTALYRFTDLGDWVPSVGIGPRVYLLQTLGEGRAGGETILETSEQSTKLGVGLPIGVEYAVGPGQITGEALLEWAPLDHRITGEASLLGANLFLGYRMLL